MSDMNQRISVDVAGGTGGRRTLRMILATLLAGTALTTPALADVLPTGGHVVAGSGAVAQSGGAMTVTQGSDRMAVDWQGFSVGAGNSVAFVQPSASSVALNRVLGADPSVIQGALTANGQVFLVNPNGVLFSPTARVDVGGLVASTLNITTEDFMAGRHKFAGASAASVVNQGDISAPGGAVALIAARIINDGRITANGGSVLLGAGSRVTLDIGGPVPLEVENDTLETLIENGGAIRAEGGVVWMTSQAAGTLASSVINTTGLIEATTLATGEKGQIILFAHGGTAEISGTLDASAPDGGDGGFVETSGKTVRVSDDARVTTRASQGQTGTWLIDPNDFTVAADGGDMTGAVVTANLADTNFEIATATMGTPDGNGDIHINDGISWGTNTLTLTAERDININAAMTATGTAGLDMTTGADRFIRAGFGEDNTFAGKVDMAGTTSLTVNGQGYTIISDTTALQNMNVDLAGHYALGTDLALTGTNNWTPVGATLDKFTGSFDGLGHTVSGLNIDTADSNVGLFGFGQQATLRNIGLLDVDISAGTYAGSLLGRGDTVKINNAFATGSASGESRVGGLVGGTNFNHGRNHVSAARSSVSVTGPTYLGGLVGDIVGMDIFDSHATGSVIASGNMAGGLTASFDNSTATRTYATGAVSANGHQAGGLLGYVNNSTVSQSFATGDVTIGASNWYAGGLAGEAWGSTITDSYATGAVTGGNGAGGLVGETDSAITRSFSSGAVSGADNVGGLIGGNYNATITDSYWDVGASGQPTSGGGTGLASAQMVWAWRFNDWDDTVWGFGDGAAVEGYAASRPYLVSTTPQALRPDQTVLFASGWGDADGAGAYTITDWNQLANINAVPARGFDFVLANDLDASTAGYAAHVKDGDTLANGGTGWLPLGVPTVDLNDVFYGSFNGQDHTISGLIAAGTDYVGLFGVSLMSSISNVSLIDADVDSTGEGIGMLLGWGMWVTVSNASATGQVTSTGGAVGGLIGTLVHGTVERSHAVVTLSGNGDVGGLLGSAIDTTISRSSAEMTLTMTADQRPATAGGIFGYGDETTIQNSYAVGTMTFSASDFDLVDESMRLGGLAGQSFGMIENSYADVDITLAIGDIGASDEERSRLYVGGLVGENGGGIVNSYAFGNVSVEAGDVVTGVDGDASELFVGGLIGRNRGETSLTANVSAGPVVLVNGTVDETSLALVGDFIGSNDATPSEDDGEYVAGTDKTDRATFIAAGWDFTNETDNGSDDVWGVNPDVNGGRPNLGLAAASGGTGGDTGGDTGGGNTGGGTGGDTGGNIDDDTAGDSDNDIDDDIDEGIDDDINGDTAEDIDDGLAGDSDDDTGDDTARDIDGDIAADIASTNGDIGDDADSVQAHASENAVIEAVRTNAIGSVITSMTQTATTGTATTGTAGTNTGLRQTSGLVPATTASTGPQRGFSVSGGLRLVQVGGQRSGQTQSGGQDQGGDQNQENDDGETAEVPADEGGMDASGFMRVFVVNGGINLPDSENGAGQ